MGAGDEGLSGMREGAQRTSMLRDSRTIFAWNAVSSVNNIGFGPEQLMF